jgi:hypothetical protein
MLGVLFCDRIAVFASRADYVEVCVALATAKNNQIKNNKQMINLSG